MRIYLFPLLYLLWPFYLAQAISLDELVQKTIEAEERNNRRLQGWRYRQNIQIEKLDAKFNTQKTEQFAVWITASSNITYTVTAAENSDSNTSFIPGQTRPLSKKELKKVRDANTFSESFRLRDLGPKFELELLGKEVLAQGSAYVLAFKPQPKLRAKNRQEKVINHLTGKLWILTDSFLIIRSEATLSEPVSLAWFLVSMKELHFTYSAQKLSNGLSVPKALELFFNVRAALSSIRQRQTIQMSDFQHP